MAGISRTSSIKPPRPQHDWALFSRPATTLSKPLRYSKEPEAKTLSSNNASTDLGLTFPQLDSAAAPIADAAALTSPILGKAAVPKPTWELLCSLRADPTRLPRTALAALDAAKPSLLCVTALDLLGQATQPRTKNDKAARAYLCRAMHCLAMQNRTDLCRRGDALPSCLGQAFHFRSQATSKTSGSAFRSTSKL